MTPPSAIKIRRLTEIHKHLSGGSVVVAGNTGTGTGRGFVAYPVQQIVNLVLAGYAEVTAQVTKEHGLRTLVSLTVEGALLVKEPTSCRRR